MKAAQEGYLEAQFLMGLMYLDGDGVIPDDVETLKWLWSAAGRGYAQASELLQFNYNDDFGHGC